MHLYLAPSLGVTPWNFAEMFGVRKLESLGYEYGFFCVIGLAVLVEHRLVTDGQTYGETDTL